MNDVFYNACENGNVDLVNQWLQQGNFDSNFVFDNGLCKASRHGHVQVVELLLQDGRANPATVDNYPLRTACYYGYLKIAQRLLQEPYVDPSYGKNCALRWACIQNHPTIVDRLLQDNRVDPCIQHCSGVTLLTMACESGFFEIVQRLFKDSRINTSQNRISAMQTAYFYKHCNIIDMLLLDPLIDSMSENMPNFHMIQMIRSRVAEVCIGLQDFSLPALVTLEIIDALIPNSVKMYDKWNLICMVKHFCKS